MAGKKNGADADPSGLRAAGKALAEQDAKKAMVQTTFLHGEPHEEFVQMSVIIPVSDSEAKLLDREASDLLADAKRRQEALEALIASDVTPEKAAIKELMKTAGRKATESRDRKREQMQRVRVVYHVNRATKEYLDPETGDAVKVSEAMTGAEIERFSLAEAPLTPPDTEPVEAP